MKTKKLALYMKYI